MFELPIYLEPAVLLEYETLSRAAEVRRIRLLSACRRDDWREGRHWLQARFSGDWLSWAVTLVHLGDESLRARRSNTARQAYRLAQIQFHQQAASVHRQNEAVASYGLALTAWVMGDSDAALELLEQAIQLCGKAQMHWIAVQADYARAYQCRNITSWFEALADQIAQSQLAEMDIFGALYAQPPAPALAEHTAPLPHIRLPGISPVWEKPRSWHVTAERPSIIGQKEEPHV